MPSSAKTKTTGSVKNAAKSSAKKAGKSPVKAAKTSAPKSAKPAGAKVSKPASKSVAKSATKPVSRPATKAAKPGSKAAPKKAASAPKAVKPAPLKAPAAKSLKTKKAAAAQLQAAAHEAAHELEIAFQRENTARPVNERDVESYLRSNTNFLRKYPSLLDILDLPTAERGNITSLQGFQARKLQQKVQMLEDRNARLVRTAHGNIESIRKIEEMVLAFISAASFESFLKTVQKELLAEEGLESVVMILAKGVKAPAKPALPTMSTAEIDDLFGETDLDVRLRQITEETEASFHKKGMESDALLRLRDEKGRTIGALALGSPYPTHYHAGQGTELIGFLGASIGRCLSRILKSET